MYKYKGKENAMYMIQTFSSIIENSDRIYSNEHMGN